MREVITKWHCCECGFVNNYLADSEETFRCKMTVGLKDGKIKVKIVNRFFCNKCFMVKDFELRKFEPVKNKQSE